MTQWPRFARYTLLAFLIASAFSCYFMKLWITSLPLVERYDMPAYIRVNLPEIPLWHTYTLVMRDPGHPATPEEEGTFYIAKSQRDPEKLKQWFYERVYHASVWWVLKVPLLFCFLTSFLLVVLGRRLDRKYNVDARDGRNLRGPQLVSERKFNSRVKTKDRWISIDSNGVKYWISREKANHHFAICGATGGRKSHIVRQLAEQFLAAGIPCVFFDHKREYIEEFWREGDWVLDPGDMRCPRWALEEEAIDEMRAMAIAQSAFPDEPRDQPFFKKNPRALLAYLIGTYNPTTQQLASWMVDDTEIDKRVKGDIAGMLNKQAGEMRGGILATLKEFGRSLRLWPTDESLPKFSVKNWKEERKGNIFLTSSPETLDALRPIQSMLLDMIILGMQSKPGPGALILDEIELLQRLPKAETAVSLQRSAGNPIVLCFQEVSQLKAHYGDLWKAIVSQPYTQIVFRTGEEEAAKHAAGILGQAQIERIRENRQAWSLFFHKPHRSYQQERVIEHPVMPGEIQSLPDGHGYLAQAGYIVPLDIPIKPPVKRAERLIERVIRTPFTPLPPEPPDTKPKPYRVRRKMATPIS